MANLSHAPLASIVDFGDATAIEIDADENVSFIGEVKAPLFTKGGAGVPSRAVYNNKGNTTIEGSLGVGADITDINRWSNGDVEYILNSDTFDVGDIVIVSRLWLAVGVITVSTMGRTIYYPNISPDTSATITDVPMTVTFTKLDATQWGVS